MSKNDGGRAFPEIRMERDIAFPSGGMSLRDYFAGQALAAIIAYQPNGENLPKVPSDLAARAYRAADAMLEARSR